MLYRENLITPVGTEFMEVLPALYSVRLVAILLELVFSEPEIGRFILKLHCFYF